jgi:hypothetical protein
MTRLDECKLITLPNKADERGLLGIVEGQKDIPFEIKRIFYLYDVPEHQSRGAHAHKECHQFLIAFNGGFSVELDNGVAKKNLELTSPTQGLYIPPMIWTSVKEFAVNAVCLVLTSHGYDEEDYHRDYELFLKDLVR